jgi:hypothetical protein
MNALFLVDPHLDDLNALEEPARVCVCARIAKR